MNIRHVLLLLVFVFLFSACMPQIISTPEENTEPTPACPDLPDASTCTGADEPFQISGSFEYSNSIITTYYNQQAVALVDMYAFITRDKEWEIPVASQTLGFLDLDLEAMTGEYVLQLPARPTATQADVDNNGQEDAGVQVFAVSYWPNLISGPYSEGDDRSRGWPSYLASVKTDTENQDEVIGGQLVVWSPDAGQSFPTDFGADGLLFTADDPAASISAGYTIVDLDVSPFRFFKEPEPKLSLYEPDDVEIKDFAALGYAESFEKMFAFVKLNYAFNGIEGKQPDWDALYADLKPRAEDAEKSKDAKAYYEVIRDFTFAFKDGHVGLTAGDYANQDFSERIAGGYGFAVRELDDGSVTVIFVTEGGPAQAAGIKVGAVVTEFGEQPVADAIGAAQPFVISSSDFAHRYQQQRYFLRTAVGTETAVTFQNPGETVKTVTLAATAERDSFARTSVYYNVDLDNMLPVEFDILQVGNVEIGYVEINSNYDDLGLIIELFERALKTFQAREVAGIIIDMRYNGGGANLGLAGFLTENEIPMGQLEYFSEATGKFEPEGLPDKVIANENQYRFDKMVLLVGQTCASACELESYGFSQVPEMITVGMYPTAGVEAEVARGQFELPEGFSLQVPTGRMTLPDGSIFLEGVGVQPTFRVPLTLETVTSEEDVVLQYGIRAILEPLGTDITPAKAPTVLTPDETKADLEAGKVVQLEEKARESYDDEARAVMDTTFPYTIVLSESEPLLWAWGWCAADDATLENNLAKIKVEFDLNGEPVAIEQLATLSYSTDDNRSCFAYFAQVTDFVGGEHHLVTTVTLTSAVNDGEATYPAGQQVFDYAVYIKP
jgi:C-terminal processing protease CtpA/Prc